MVRWDDIEKIYKVADFPIQKGSAIHLLVILDQELDEFYNQFLGNFVDTWTFPKGDSDIRPFMLHFFQNKGSSFEVELSFRNKQSDLDELKLLCQDMLHIFNTDNIHILQWIYIKKS